MGTVGIFDADIYKYIQVPFNLEAMKLASYYKNKREIVTASPAFAPDRYTKFIYRKDYEDGDYPQRFYKIPNIEYGGLAFSGNVYDPMDDTIEKMRPDPSIYLPYQQSFCTNKKLDRAFKTMYNAQHCRLSLDGKEIWKDYSSQFSDLSSRRTLFLHDYNVAAIKDSYETIQDILDHMSSCYVGHFIGTKFPIQVNNFTDLKKWMTFNPTEMYFTIQYNGLMKDADFVYFVKKNATAPISRQLEYMVTKNCSDENDFAVRVLPRIFKQVIFSRSQHTRILLKYEPEFFVNQEWCKVIDFINSYACSLFDINEKKYYKILPDDSAYSFAKNLKENPIIKDYPIDKIGAREVFQFVREKNYEVFCDFYECHQVKLIQGELKNV